ncbi:GntR family transcriptional regulator [Streptomyces marispadix]|uniref:GntR family transcriptional regulator n=1 Tax=Streptomyces marispadix TaxID=2922868 RepID=A0ABS9SZG0_9ACTN|nr:GntR family transcriptional regulator [Streptomyces marispadix]MCH6161649.1 GntR family transcriptional regulator [Streptomyces marispadix]
MSVVDALVGELRELVFRGDLAAGTRVSEAALAERFQVARPSVRAALQALVQSGLLYREPNRSVYVPRLGPEDVRDLFAVRTLLEVDAVHTLARRGIRPAPAMRALRQLEALTDDDGWHEVVAHDLALHRALVDGVGSPRMSRVYAGITDEIRLCITQLRFSYQSPRQIAEEHRELVEEVCSGDADRAVAACRGHLEASERILLTGHA